MSQTYGYVHGEPTRKEAQKRRDLRFQGGSLTWGDAGRGGGYRRDALLVVWNKKSVAVAFTRRTPVALRGICWPGLVAGIAGAQQPEIDTMTGWLEAWGEDTPGMAGMDHSGMDMDMDMDGMSQEDVMAHLETLEGAEFDASFLEHMIAHHEGAVTMSEAEIQDEANQDATTLVQAIIEDQTARDRRDGAARRHRHRVTTCRDHRSGVRPAAGLPFVVAPVGAVGSIQTRSVGTAPARSAGSTARRRRHQQG